jgi:hypothetical protein
MSFTFYATYLLFYEQFIYKSDKVKFEFNMKYELYWYDTDNIWIILA